MAAGRKKMDAGLEEKLIEFTIRTQGFLFPETVQEVIEFEKIYGTTEITLPEHLKSSSFLENQPAQPHNYNLPTLSDTNSNFAFAAREGKKPVPDHIREKMLKDRNDAELKYK